MLPGRHALLFALLLSAMMSFIVSGISTARVVDVSNDFLMVWLPSWVASWAIAFPCVLLIAPIARKLVAWLLGPPPV